MAFIGLVEHTRPDIIKWNNDLYTPPIWFAYLQPFLEKAGLKNKIAWEMCYGKGHLAKAMQEKWFKVIGDPSLDCFDEIPMINGKEIEFDYIVTNPPYSNNKMFVKRAMDSWKPFAILFRLEHLGWVEAYNIFKESNFEIIIPKKRINFISENMLQAELRGETPKKSSSSFHTVWLTSGLNIGKQLVWYDIGDEIK